MPIFSQLVCYLVCKLMAQWSLQGLDWGAYRIYEHKLLPVNCTTSQSCHLIAALSSVPQLGPLHSCIMIKCSSIGRKSIITVDCKHLAQGFAFGHDVSVTGLA
jgi:hypothetical protein